MEGKRWDIRVGPLEGFFGVFGGFWGGHLGWHDIHSQLHTLTYHSYIPQLHTSTFTFTFTLHLHHIYIYIYIYIHTCIYTCTRHCVSVCWRVCVCVCVFLSEDTQIVRPSIYPLTCLYVRLSVWAVFPPSVCRFVCLSNYESFYLYFFFLSVFWTVSLFVCMYFLASVAIGGNVCFIVRAWPR